MNAHRIVRVSVIAGIPRCSICHAEVIVGPKPRRGKATVSHKP